ncbi:MAG: hypothetical protein FJ095_12450 [Deltaproteobacteria bacterium]|nr:hypothetical protein [Deltaproteobacteria bacterium]
MDRLRLQLGLAGPCLVLLVGCAGHADAWKKDVGELKRELHVLRSENIALRERLEALEASGARSPTAASTATDPSAARPSASDRPRLEVVRLSPEERPNDGWVTIDPSDPRRARGGTATPVDGPATEIRSERGGAVVQRPAATTPAPTTPPPRK